MSSPRLQKQSDFDATIGRELKSWAARQQPPADARARLLEAAAAQSQKPTERRAPRASAMTKVQRWLSAVVPSRRNPQLPYTELSQWLFNQAMWQSLGNDRRAVRFVC